MQHERLNCTTAPMVIGAPSCFGFEPEVHHERPKWAMSMVYTAKSTCTTTDSVQDLFPIIYAQQLLVYEVQGLLPLILNLVTDS